MSADLFLKTLFQSKPANNFLLIWEKRKDKKVSYWFDKVSDAITHFNKQGQKQDTYIGCGTSSVALPGFRRCKAEEISGIPGVWLDIDILDPAHKKSHLPETPEKAQEIINAFPLKPTIVVHSGHGYQIWWVFKHFRAFRSAKERDEAADLIHDFTWTMRDFARSLGYDIDMTFDLSRVFRIPGGRNFKDNPPVPVVLEKCTDNFYSTKEFRDALLSFRDSLGNKATPIERKKSAANTSKTVQGASFLLDPEAMPPQDKLDILLELDAKFKASWEHRRKDFKDDSPSAYDLSLASFAFAAEWEVQEIVDLLIAFRRINGLKLKLNEQYFEKTLRAASNVLESKKDFYELEGMVADRSLTNNDKEKIAQAKEILLRLLKINIRRIIRYDISPVEYKLETDTVCIHLGGVNNLIGQPTFRSKVAEATGVLFWPIKAEKWQSVAQALLDLCETTSAGNDTSNRGQVKNWVCSYLEQHTPLYDPNDAFEVKKPFYFKDSLYFFGPELRKYVGMFLHDIINPKAMGIMLREYGFKPLDMNFKKSDKWVSRSVWKIKITEDEIAQAFLNQGMLDEANRILAEQMSNTKDE